MKYLKYVSWFVVGMVFISEAIFSAERTTEKQLLSLAVIGCSLMFALACCVAGLWFRTRDKFRAFYPAMICLIGLPVGFAAGISVGNQLKDIRFERNLPRYKEVVHLIEKGEIKKNASDAYTFELPTQYADLARMVWAETNSKGAVYVEFITELGFPVKHSGYFYTSSGKIDGDTKTLHRWPLHSEICTNWFRISD